VRFKDDDSDDAIHRWYSGTASQFRKTKIPWQLHRSYDDSGRHVDQFSYSVVVDFDDWLDDNQGETFPVDVDMRLIK